MRRISAQLTFSNVVACLALFVALGGASYAATQLPQNSVTSKQIKKGTIQLADLSKTVRQRLAVPVGPAGPAGPKGATGATGPAGPNSGAESLPSGKTLRGILNFDSVAATASDDIGGDISFGATLAKAPTVVIRPEEAPPTAECPGKLSRPEAAPGFFCIYEASTNNVKQFSVCDTECENFPAATAYGAEIYVFPEKAGRYFVNGSWAVTAP